jgi:phosphoglycolate phosphatase-like HAD superfamily hydrolase
VVFDLDGTLLAAGSGRGILAHAALVEAWPEHPEPSPGPVQLERGGDREFATVFAELAEAWPEERRTRAALAHERLCAETRRWGGLIALPGAIQVLERLRANGQRLWVATNATQADAERALAGLGLSSGLEAVLGIDPRRPEPKQRRMRRWAEELGWPEGVLVGDSPGDLEAARAAGLVAIHYLGSGADAESSRGAAATIQHLALLPELLDRRPARVAALAAGARGRGAGLAVEGGAPGAAERWARWLSTSASIPIRPWALAGWRVWLADVGSPAPAGADLVLDLSQPLDPAPAEPPQPR